MNQEVKSLPSFTLKTGVPWVRGEMTIIDFPPVSRERAIAFIEDPLTGDPNTIHSDSAATQAVLGEGEVSADAVILPGALLVAMCNSRISRLLGNVLLRKFNIRFGDAIVSGESFFVTCTLSGVRPGSRNTWAKFDITATVERNGCPLRVFEGGFQIFGPPQ